MKLKAFSIYDSKAEAYHAPFFLNTVGLAIRTFEELANDLKTSIGKYPHDYTLFHIGDFNDQSGTLTAYSANVPIGGALEYVHRDPAQPWLDLTPTDGSRDPTKPDSQQ